MIQVIILVCAAKLSPAECQRETAIDVITGPQVASIGACALVGQTTMAGTSLAGGHSGEYLKIRCEPFRETAAKF